LKWLFYRAEFLTTLVRELRYEMERMKKGHLKLAVWIRPSCYLYDGVDLDTWLEEGLVHEVIVSAYRGDELPGPLELQKKIQEKAEFHVEILGTDTEEERIKSKIASYANRNVDGICIYESNLAVTRPLWRELISKLWGEKRKE
jgi:hypothetical protein